VKARAALETVTDPTVKARAASVTVTGPTAKAKDEAGPTVTVRAAAGLSAEAKWAVSGYICL
jgi:hypothetical protein